MKISRNQKSNTRRNAAFVKIPRATAKYLAELSFIGVAGGFRRKSINRSAVKEYHEALRDCVGSEDELGVVEDATHFRNAMLALGMGKNLRVPSEIVAEVRHANPMLASYNIGGRNIEFTGELKLCVETVRAWNGHSIKEYLRCIVEQLPKNSSIEDFVAGIIQGNRPLVLPNGIAINSAFSLEAA